jgi:hypothetical protein
MVEWHLDVMQDVFFAGLFSAAEYEVPSNRNRNIGTANRNAGTYGHTGTNTNYTAGNAYARNFRRMGSEK